jgi:hypothetical protein
MEECCVDAIGDDGPAAPAPGKAAASPRCAKLRLTPPAVAAPESLIRRILRLILPGATR